MSDADKARIHRALATMEKMSRRIRQLEQGHREPIAIVGMACRLPGGVHSLAGYWELLREGRCGIREVPGDRWDVQGLYDPDPQAPGKMYTTRMGVVDGMDLFDAGLFGIAPREAQMLDPQHRMLLELTREGLEHAGIAPGALQGSKTGVFVGVGVSEYGRKVLYPERTDTINAYSPTGNAPSTAAGRLSYTFGFKGPAMTLDTACSTSLVAVHLALASLRARESDLAIAGGSNAILQPHSTIGQCRLGALSPEGLCKAFDASADGYARGEGGGIVVLKRLADAERDGDTIHAVIVGSAVNQDGRSAGLTAPSGPAQSAVIRAALAAAELGPGDIDYVEAHGTGTPLGDPIELGALQAAIGAERDADDPLPIASVKTNLGHLESAAGVAALIKVALSLQHRELPAHLHFRQPTPNVEWPELNLRVQAEHGPWPERPGPRRAGISSFGFSGTNCHVVVQEAPTRSTPAEAERICVVPISARSDAALRRQAAALAGLDLDVDDLVAIGRTAARGRDHFDHRAAVVAASGAGLRADLEALAAGEPRASTVVGRSPAPPKIAFVFSGQGAQYPGMGQALFATLPVFRQTVERLDAAYRARTSESIWSVMQAGDRLHETRYTQPALFVLETALLAQWRAWGIRPRWVCGHSVGEYAAACAAGVFEPEDGLALLIERARLMDGLAERGGMLSIEATEGAVLEAIGADGDRVSIAALNAPAQTVISGSSDALARVGTRLTEAGCRVRPLKVSHAFHSHLMDPILDAFERFAASRDLQRPTIPLVSNLTGARMDAAPTADYYRRHIREPVRFADSVSSLLAAGADAIVEIGPHPVLLGLTEHHDVGRIASLRRGRDELEALHRALAELYTRGAAVDWTSVYPSGRRVVLPPYPYEKKRHWLDTPLVTAPGEPQDTSTAPLLEDCYGVDWTSIDPPASAGPAKCWLVLDRDGDLQPLCAALTEAGHAVTHRRLDAPGETAGHDGVLVRPPTVDGLPARAKAAADLVAALASIDDLPPLWLVTLGAHGIDGDTPQPWEAAWWGLGRSWAAERPGSWGGLLDLPAAPIARSLAHRVARLLAQNTEDELAVRSTGTYAARLRRLAPGEAGTQPLPVRDDATYLVTGASGALGGEVATWLAERGARHLLLVSRRADDPALAGRWDALRRRGATVHLAPIDVADADAMAAAVAAIPADRPLAAIFHAAGVADDALLADLDPARFSAVLAPKLAGVHALTRATEGRDLDALVLFSSMASVLGSPGQANYALANAYLDAFAAAERAAGRPAVSVSWGAWADKGMAARLGDGHRRRLAERGIEPISPARGIAALSRLAASRRAHVLVCPADWGQFVRTSPRRLGSVLSTWADDTAPVAPVRRPTSLPQLQEFVADQVAFVLGFESRQSVDPDLGFADMGMDSLTSVELRGRLAQLLDVRLPTSVALDYPSVRRLTDHLARTVLALVTDAPTAAAAPTVDPREPIAIVGAACRFPGAASLADYWDLLRDRVNAVVEIPADRWDANALYDPDPSTPGKCTIRRGGFLPQVDRFDARFFRIAPREADSIDPQQRLMLEIAWEAFEHAGLPISTLRETPTGVFIGAGINDYGDISIAADPLSEDPYAITGNGLCFVAGRVSFALGLRGPSLNIDTACSSSLVAVHLACQSLRQGECRTALAGGVHLMLSPRTFQRLSRIQAFSPHERCWPFDDGADGYVRGEGCGAVVLKRLSDAEADGDRILAVIRGTATNHDGPSSGLTVPSGPAQQELLRAALREAGLQPRDIDAIEAHGTGTPLGDPIEVGAIGAVYAGDRGDAPLRLGSVKGNFGHLEAAAGIAGLLKMVLALEHGVLPGQPHFEAPSTRIPWDELRVAVSAATQPWPDAADRPRRAGVSSFGLSGTNAHAVLEAAPAVAASPVVEAIPHALALSAHCAEALRDAALRMADFLDLDRDDVPDPADVCHTAAVRREHLAHRLVATGTSRAELAAALRDDGTAVVHGIVPASSAGPVFVFSGQGGQFHGMARTLLAEGDEVLQACDAALRPILSWSVLDELAADEATSRLDALEVLQPVLFSIQVAVTRRLIAAGVRPAAVVGHSMGEVAAAHIAGAIDLPTACLIIARRSAILARIRGQGTMALAALGRDEAERLVREHGGGVAVAGCNSPRSSVLSGPPHAIEELLGRLQAQDVFCRRISADVASHSPQVDALKDAMREAFTPVRPQPGDVPFYSTGTARLEPGEHLDADYWVRNARVSVEFARTMEAIAADGFRAFIEIGVHPVLLPAIRETLDEGGVADATAWGTLRRDEDDHAQLRAAVLQAHCVGIPIDWSVVGADAPGRRVVDLPSYPFQRQRHWIAPRKPDAWSIGLDAPGHALHGNRLPLPGAVAQFVAPLLQPYLPDHRVFGTVVVPGAFHVALALSAARELLPGPGALEVGDVTFYQVVILEDGDRTALHATATPRGDGVDFTTSTASGDGFTTHAEITVRRASTAAPTIDRAALEARCPEQTAEIYGRLAQMAIDLGPSFRWIRSLRRGEGEALAELATPADLRPLDAPLHPTLLDACFQTLSGAAPAHVEDTYAPFAVERLRVFGEPSGHLWCHAQLRPDQDPSGETMLGDLVLFDDDGRCVVEISGFCSKRADRRSMLRVAAEESDGWLLEVGWRRQAPPRAVDPAVGGYLVLLDRDGVGKALAQRLTAAGCDVHMVRRAGTRANGVPTLDPRDPHGFDAALQAWGRLPRPRGIVDLWALDLPEDPTEADVPDAIATRLHLLQSVLRARAAVLPSVWLVTRGAQAVGADEVVTAPARSALWGLVRTVHQEHPELPVAALDLDPSGVDPELLARTILDAGRETQVALRAGERLVARLQRATPPSLADLEGLAFDPHGSVLVTGGWGGLGLTLAAWLVDRGVKHLVLAGRSEPSPRARAEIDRLRAQGADVQLQTADVSNADAVAHLVEIANARGAGLRAVFHLAGSLHDATLAQQSIAAVEAVCAAKVGGALHLHDATARLPLDHFVLYSSASALIGSPGQTNYAAANAFLDGLAHHRRGLGLPGLSIDWGPFEGVGAAATDERAGRLDRRGARALTPEDARALLGRVLALRTAQVGVVPLDVRRLLEFAPQIADMPVFEELLQDELAASQRADRGALATALRDAAPPQRPRVLEDRLRVVLGRVLRTDGAGIDVGTPFGDLGLDSLMGLEVKNSLEVELDVRLRASLLWTYPTLATLRDHLLESVAPAPEPAIDALADLLEAELEGGPA